MCLECFQLYGVSLDPAHHAAIKRRPNRHVRRVKSAATPVTPRPVASTTPRRPAATAPSASKHSTFKIER